jgi:hypothetical protein
MYGKTFLLVALCIVGTTLVPGVAGATDYSGKFDGQKLSVVIVL